MQDRPDCERGQIMYFRLSLRIRLFIILTLLGLIPVTSAALTLHAVNRHNEADEAAHKAVRNTLYLERINSHIFAVVAENRGMYLSSEGWSNVERFAASLMAH